MPSATEVVPRSVGRVLDLLEIVLAAGECNLTRAAAQAELTPTTALRHLRALETRGYVMRDDAGQFAAGPTLHRIAATLREQGPLDNIVAAAQPHLEELANQTGESAYLAVSDGLTAAYVATAESTAAIRHVGWVGQTVPLKGSAIGAALASPGTIAVRHGAVEPDITAVSLALQVASPVPIALSVVGPQHRLGPKAQKTVSAAIKAAASQISRTIGSVSEEVAS